MTQSKRFSKDQEIALVPPGEQLWYTQTHATCTFPPSLKVNPASAFGEIDNNNKKLKKITPPPGEQ